MQQNQGTNPGTETNAAWTILGIVKKLNLQRSGLSESQAESLRIFLTGRVLPCELVPPTPEAGGPGSNYAVRYGQKAQAAVHEWERVTGLSEAF